jgi:hypothetical protein
MVSSYVTIGKGNFSLGDETMKNKIWIGILAVFIISAVSLITVFAYKGDPSVNGPNYNEDVHAQLEAAIETGNYDSWIQIRKDNNLPMNGRMFQVVNKDNFKTFAQMHEAMQSGNTEKADALREELGLGQGMGRQGQRGTRASRYSASSGTGKGMGPSGTGCGSCPMHN